MDIGVIYKYNEMLDNFHRVCVTGCQNAIQSGAPESRAGEMLQRSSRTVTVSRRRKRTPVQPHKKLNTAVADGSCASLLRCTASIQALDGFVSLVVFFLLQHQRHMPNSFN
ncbi:uncharacterized [Tachysurus ichikawai]